MALSNDELGAAKELREQGYSNSEILGFISTTRAGKPSRISDQFTTPEPVTEQGRFDDVGQDISSGFQGVKDSFSSRVDNIADAVESGNEGKQTPIETGLQLGSNIVGMATDTIGQAITTGASIFTSQKEEDAASQLLAAGIDKTGLPEKYAKLTDRQKRNIGVGSTLLAAATGGVGGAASKSAARKVKTGIDEANSAVTKLSIARQGLKENGISKSGAEGKKQALSFGFSPEELMQRVARVSKSKQAKFEDRAGQPIGSYLVDRDIFGTPDEIVDQLLDRMTTSKGKVDETLKQAKGDIKHDSVDTALTQLIERDVKVTNPGAPSQDGGRITALYRKNKEIGLTLSEINDVKRLYERNVRVDYANPANPQPEKLVASNNVDSALRNLVVAESKKRGFDNISELNRETSLAKQLLDDLGAEYAGSLGNNNISLTDWILVAEAAGNPTGAAALGIKKTLGSKTIMSSTAKLLSRNKGVKSPLPEAGISNSKPIESYAEYLKSISLETK